MLLLETYLNFSNDKGLGVFSKENILKGTKFWIRNEIFDKVIPSSHLSNLNDMAIEYIKKYGFLEITGNWYLCSDNDRFTNHSKEANVIHHFNDEGLIVFATVARDIQIGEEILCDYTEICLHCKTGISFIEK